MKSKNNSISLIINLGIYGSIIAGFFLAGIIGTILKIISHRYFAHHSFKLIALELLSLFQKWLLFSTLILIIFSGVLFISRKLSSGRLNSHPVKSELLNRVKMIPVLIILIFVVLVNIGLIFITGSSGTKRPNVIIIVVDALRADALSLNRNSYNTSPEIDRFGERSLNFSNAYASSSWTKPSIASLFSSFHPVKHNTLEVESKLPEKINTLTEILKNDGYKTFMLSGGNPYIGTSFDFDQGFDNIFNRKADAGELTTKMSSLIRELKEEKFFIYTHFMDTHLPYNKNKFNNMFLNTGNRCKFEPGEIKLRSVREMDKAGILTEDDKTDLKDLYNGQVRYVDENIGKIISLLEQESLLDNTIVVITSDHGEEFWDHGKFEHGHSLYNELLRIPLIIGGKDLKYSTIKRNMSIVDIAPLILDEIDIPAEKFNFDGSGLKRSMKGRVILYDRSVFAAGILYGYNKYCLIKGDKKIIYNQVKKNKVHEKKNWKNRLYEYYNITADPQERNNLIRKEKNKAYKMVTLLNKYIQLKKTLISKKGSIEKKMKERLKTLGYL